MQDTVGFITDLPHGLVESFKSTLDEIHFADVIVHVRDISHPHSNHQRETVLKVLEDIGVSKDVIDTKYLEVWNKVDLVEDQEGLEERFKEAVSEATYPIIMTSCETQLNKDLLLECVSDMAETLMDKQQYTLTYPCTEHN